MPLDLSSPERVEGLRRSIIMLTPRAAALNREQAIEVLEVLLVALEKLDRVEAALRHPSRTARA